MIYFVAIIYCLFYINIVYSQPSTDLVERTDSSLRRNADDQTLSINELNNLSSLEIQVENSPSSDQNYITILIPAVSAVTAGIIGAYATYRYGVLKERKKELDFKASITAMVYYEFKIYLKFISEILDTSEAISTKGDPNARVIRDESELRTFRSTLKGFSKQYGQLTLEKKAIVFKAEILVKIETIYERFYGFQFLTFRIGTVDLDGCFYFNDLESLKNEIREILRLINNDGNKELKNI